jgi:nitrite reductase (NADH) small subunit
MWRDVGPANEVTKLRKVVLADDDGRAIVVVAHDGEFYAMQNECIHRQRELSKGVVLNGRLVCPGHQWSFELGSGWEAVKEQCQPTYPVRVQDGVVQVDTAARRIERDATDLVAD